VGVDGDRGFGLRTLQGGDVAHRPGLQATHGIGNRHPYRVGAHRGIDMVAGDGERRAGAARLRHGARAFTPVAPFDAGAEVVRLAAIVLNAEGGHGAVEVSALDRGDRVRPDLHTRRRDVDDAQRLGRDLVVAVAVVLQAQRAAVGPDGVQRLVREHHAGPWAGPFGPAQRQVRAFFGHLPRRGERGAAIGAGGHGEEHLDRVGANLRVIPGGGQHAGALVHSHSGQELLAGGGAGDAHRVGPGGAIVRPDEVGVEVALDLDASAVQCQVVVAHIEAAPMRPAGVVPGQYGGQAQWQVGQRRHGHVSHAVGGQQLEHRRG